MSGFQNKDGKPVVMGMIKAIQQNRSYLSEIDGAIGDGDHGINMSKGFTLCEEAIGDQDVSFAEALVTLGDTLLNEIGGSMGPIYGMLFSDMGVSIIDEETVDEEVFSRMLQAGLDSLQDIVPAQVGDKTLMDALLPAIDVYRQTLDRGGSFASALTQMKKAAAAGRDATKDMVAKLGRASRLGERSRGVIDPGAASCAILLEAMADGIAPLLALSAV